MEEKSGFPLYFGTCQGRIHSQYRDPSFIDAISDCGQLLNQPECQILLEGRNRIGVVRIKRQDEEVEVVLKEFKSRGVNKLKSLFLPSKALRAWKGAVNLIERGIDTPFPIAFLEKRKRGFLEQSFYLAEKIEEAEEIRSLFLKSSPEKLKPLLTGLADHLSVYHQKGVLHRDLSDGNILVKEDEKGKTRFYFLDTNRIRFPRKISLLKRVKNLIRLGVPLPFQSFFLKQYLGEDRRCLWFWYRANKVIYTCYVAFKRKLRLRQLAQKLKIQ
ncbi:MAG: hypothetical protein GTO17_09995 [Candidatus Aminicenantes bacterium]|nr:hypothetical protein [Candidatus Aminicenantes bacterium]